MESNSIRILRSILAPETLIAHLEAAYTLQITRIQLIKAIVLDTYRLWTNLGLYILRVYPSQRRTLDEINAELDFITYLHNHSVRVSIPVLQHNGERLLALPAPEGTRYAVVFTYAHGEPVGKNLAAIRTYGHTLAHIHVIADSLPQTFARTALDLEFLLDRPLAQLAKFDERRSDWAFLKQVADEIRPRIMALPTTSPQYGVCHGDAGNNNAHVDTNGQVTFFDFDFCGPSWRAYDIATFVNGESAEVTQALLAGYQAVRQLTSEEQQALPLFQIAQNIWLLGIRASYINEWGEIHFTDRFTDWVLTDTKAKFETVTAANP